MERIYTLDIEDVQAEPGEVMDLLDDHPIIDDNIEFDVVTDQDATGKISDFLEDTTYLSQDKPVTTNDFQDNPTSIHENTSVNEDKPVQTFVPVDFIMTENVTVSDQNLNTEAKQFEIIHKELFEPGLSPVTSSRTNDSLVKTASFLIEKPKTQQLNRLIEQDIRTIDKETEPSKRFYR